MNSITRYVGGCACGSIRYRSPDRELDAGYCHCKICRGTTGAPVLAWASFPATAFEYTAREPAIYRSSPHGQREFCDSCGTQIAYRMAGDTNTVDVNIGSLDDCAEIRPRCHIWFRSRIEWFNVDDDLPRYVQAKPKDAKP
jgi:hypothetical protein